MRLLPLLLAATTLALGAEAQQTDPSSNPNSAGAVAGQAAAPANAPAATGDLPVSLDRIRERLAQPPPGSTLKNLDLKPDFVVRIEERDHITRILSKLDVKSGPVPAGGLRAYEQQQLVFNKTDRPLMQPYAAFSGSEMITLAVEGLVQKYLVGKIFDGISGAQRASAERAARAEVAQAITDYCDAQPDGGRSLHLCTDIVVR
jgi:hypothetical protein